MDSGRRMTIRAAVPGDAAGTAAVHVQSWQRAYAEILDPAFLGALSVDRYTEGWNRILADVPAPRVAVALDEDGRILGFTHVCPSRDSDAKTSTGELTSIYLEPASWGAGLGSWLHDDAVDALVNSHTEATLWVLEANARARRFYERKGWTADGTIREEDVGGRRVAEVRYRRLLVAS